MPGAVLAVDLGTTGVKVAVVDADGLVVSGASETLVTRFGPAGSAEQDVEDWWQAIGRCARRAVADAGGARTVDLVAVTSQYMSLVAVGHSGRALAPALMWMDQRGAAHHPGRLWDGDASLEALTLWIDRHGIPTGGADGVGQLAFVRTMWPEVWRDATAFVQPVDHLLARITGTVAATQNTAFPLLLTDNRTWGSPAYDDELLERAGFDRAELLARLPPLEPFGCPRGEVSSAAADHLGLLVGTTVAAGTIDTTTSAVGTGAIAPGQLGIVIGTTAVVLAHLAERAQDLGHGITSAPSPVPGRSVVLAENGIGGKALDAFLANLVHADDGVTSPAGPSVVDRFEAITDLAGTAPPGANGVLFAPWLAGAMAPVFDPLVRGAFVGVGLSTNRADLARAVFEGVACNLARLVPHVAALTGGPAATSSPIVFGGGGARAALWGQLLADLTGATVQRLAAPQFTNARGAAFVAMAESGWVSWTDLDRMLVFDGAHEPDPDLEDRYRQQVETLSLLQQQLGTLARTQRVGVHVHVTSEESS